MINTPPRTFRLIAGIKPITTIEAAVILRKSPDTVRRLIKAGVLPAADCGGRDYLLRRNDVLKLSVNYTREAIKQ